MNREDDIREQMCEIGRRIWRRGICAGNEGNHCVRLDGDRILCTPSGVSKGFMEPASMCVVDLEGNPLDVPDGARITTEIRVHLAIFKKRPDVRAVVHSHPPHAGAFALAGVPLPEGIYPEAEVFLGRVPRVPYALPGTDALADAVSEHVTPCTAALIMQNHGAVTCSAKSLLDAYHRLEVLESYCRILQNVIRLGRVAMLSTEQMTEVLENKIGFYRLPDERLVDGQAVFGEHNAAFFEAFDVKPEGALP